MDILNDIYTFIESLTIVDIIFFIAIITLLILLVTLVYFIKINKDVLSEDDFFPPMKGKRKEDEIMQNITAEERDEIIEEYNDEEAELIDLEGLTKKLQIEASERATCNEYEKDQEEKAIISYEELLQKHNKYAINYEDEKIIDDLIVKKVNLNDLENKNEEETIITDVRVISYQKEEAFLAALKELNSLLN